MTKEMIKQYKAAVVDFIWNGKKSKIKYDVLLMSKEDGGAGLVDIELKAKALKATWIQTLESEKDLKTDSVC